MVKRSGLDLQGATCFIDCGSDLVNAGLPCCRIATQGVFEGLTQVSVNILHSELVLSQPTARPARRHWPRDCLYYCVSSSNVRIPRACPLPMVWVVMAYGMWFREPQGLVGGGTAVCQLYLKFACHSCLKGPSAIYSCWAEPTPMQLSQN